ncbi:transporter substrate-binding domain-containing protein [Sutcliffiella rhizosphaerae]|uniref:Arginine-binding extracellular protein ArtP n=1 Tax=Sutcliffiella rhizosphaerae TaxID=2880967 RepID=A0ABM8YP02_9BACI|nr:transporter substrate-binding domain-containing protein [Sutcliffiella rhizosphaerae]CAG9621480.1 Arginine-binding extracellular protein ArtP [Sutcliffiella rhizosphaerae]
MKKWFIVSLISILVVGVLSACGTSGNDGGSTGGSGDGDKKVLVMGTSADYPPFEYIDTEVGEEIIGFDVDLAKAITSELGYELEVRDMDFGSLITALKSGNIDLILAGMSPTEERAKQVDFTDIYYTAHHMIVSLKDSNITSVDDLEGKTVGAQMGSIQYEMAEEIAEEVNITIENRDRIPQIIQDLKTGRFDAAIIEDTVMKGYMEQDENLTGFTLDVDGNGNSIALPKDSELTEEFNRVLKEMEENGEMEKLIIKWFGGEE